MPMPTARDHLNIHRIVAACRTCDHSQQLDLAALVQAGYGDVPLNVLPLRCSACGRRGHSITVFGRAYGAAKNRRPKRLKTTAAALSR